MNPKFAKALAGLAGVVAVIALILKDNSESDEEYYKKKITAIEAALTEVNRIWNTVPMSLNEAVHLKEREEGLYKQKAEIEGRLAKLAK